jgi:glutaredoxin
MGGVRSISPAAASPLTWKSKMNFSKWGIAAVAAALLSGLNPGGGGLIASCQAAEAPKVRHQPDIVMYATSSCPYCRKARDYFTAHHVTWREIDIDSSTAAQAEWEGKKGKGTPLIFIDGKRIDGFVQEKLDTALAAYSPPPG